MLELIGISFTRFFQNIENGISLNRYLALTGLKVFLSFIFFFDLVTDILVVKFFFSERKCDPNYVLQNQLLLGDAALLPNGTRLAQGISLEFLDTARDPDEIEINYILYGALYLIFFTSSHVVQAVFR